jgi:hypothetical protein
VTKLEASVSRVTKLEASLSHETINWRHPFLMKL